MHVIDLEGNEYALQSTSTNDNETNGNQSLSATILPTRANKLFIDDIAEMWRVIDHDDVEHVIIYCKRKGEGDRLRVEIKAIPLFFDTLDNNRIYERHDEHMTANSAFTKIFDGTGFGFVLSDSFSAVQWEGFGDGETKLDTFKRALERYKAEFRIVGNTVYLESQIGRDTNIMYRHKLNASNIVQEIDAKEMWTYAKGYGDYDSGDDGGWENAGLEREYTSPLADILGIRHAPPIKNGNITDESTMDSQLKTLVDESLKISVSADIHDLRNQGYPIAQSEVGDRVFLIDERIGLNDEVRVISQSITRNWRGDVIDLNITFGSEGIAKRHQSNISTAVKDIKDLLDGKKVLPYSVLDDAVKNATKALKDAQTELTFSDNGILSVDKNDPNLVTILNSAGFGVSDDGGNTFSQSITGNGVVADTLIGKILIGQNLLIENENSTFLVDDSGVELDGGSLKITNGGLRDSDIRNADKWNGQGTFIDNEGVYTGKVTADQIKGGVLKSLNGEFEFNMNGRRMDFYSNALIRFHEGSNQLYRRNGDNAASVSFPTSQGTDIPMMVVGTDASGGTVDANSSSFVGLRIHGRDAPHSPNLVARDMFYILARADHSNGGFVLRSGYTDGVSRSFYPYDNSNNWTYNLGRNSSERRWTNIFLKNSPDVSSDERLKEDVTDNVLGYDFVKDIKTKSFRMTNLEDNSIQFGVTAQQLKETLINHGINVDDTNILTLGEDDMYGVRYTQLIAPLIKSIQDLGKRLEELEHAG